MTPFIIIDCAESRVREIPGAAFGVMEVYSFKE